MPGLFFTFSKSSSSVLSGADIWCWFERRTIEMDFLADAVRHPTAQSLRDRTYKVIFSYYGFVYTNSTHISVCPCSEELLWRDLKLIERSLPLKLAWNVTGKTHKSAASLTTRRPDEDRLKAASALMRHDAKVDITQWGTDVACCQGRTCIIKWANE